MITFSAIEIEMPSLNRELISQWIIDVIKMENKKAGEVFFLFTTDAFLLEMNEKFLNHTYYTDVITFNTSAHEAIISGEIYISLERVKENAKQIKKDLSEELFRVLVHGILHLSGYNDKTEKERKAMRLREDKYLKLLYQSRSNLLFI